MTKINGIKITYKPKDSGARTHLNHTLFGRNVYRNYRGRKYANYYPGILHDANFYRIGRGEIFVADRLEYVMKKEDLLDIFGEIDIEEIEMDVDEKTLSTGEDYWKSKAEKKGVPFRRGVKNRLLREYE